MAKWKTTPLESTEQPGALIMATVREDVAKFQENSRFKYRIEVSWPYTPADKGMPDEATSETMEQVTESLENTLAKDPVAVLTGVYTGAGRRDLVFYTLSLHIFQRKFNEALSNFPVFPFEFSAEEDPSWEEHSEMLKLALAADTDED